MRRFCPSRLRLLVVASLVTGLAVACGVLDSAPSPTPTPTTNQSLGLEIAETYGRLMLHTRLIVDPRPPAPQVKEQLRGLGEEFKVQFANYACLLDTMSGADQAEIAAAFDANRTRFLPADRSWFGDAESDYDFEDTAIRGYLEDIETLDDYAFLDRVAQFRPGEELLCG